MTLSSDSVDGSADDSAFKDFLNKAMRKVVSRRKHAQQVDEEAIGDDLQLLSKLRCNREDIDLLRAVAEHGRKTRVTTIAPVMTILRGEKSDDVSRLVTEGLLITYELVLGVCTLVRWNSDLMDREETDMIVKHAVIHPEDAYDIVAVVRERKTLQYEGVMAVLRAMRDNPAPVLAHGAL